MNRSASWIACVTLTVLTLGCGGSETLPEPEPAPPVAAPQPDAYAQALAAGGRTDEDRQDDPLRQPDEVLRFFGVEPGATVLDLFSGGGYYAEILSHLVGEEGTVLAHNNESYRKFLGDALDVRHADGRLANVERLAAEAGDLELAPGSIDLALMILSYHDVYYTPEDGSWPPIDGPALLAAIYKGLAPGRVLGIVDHAAVEGTETSVAVNDLHRIDEAVVRADLEAAGFVLEKESDILRRPEDERTLLVFDESIRRKTDRFVLLYCKPA